MREAIQIIQMLALTPPAPPPLPSQPPPPGSEGPFLSPESDVSVAHWKQPPCARRWMPWLSTMAPIWIPRGWMPDRSLNKRKRATLLPFNHAVILLVVNLPQPFIPFVVFKYYGVGNTWMSCRGGESPRFRTGFHVLFLGLFFFVVDWNAGACVSVRPQIYTDWANHYLAKSGHKRLIKDLQTDVTDGVLLAEIIQVVGKTKTNFITKLKINKK